MGGQTTGKTVKAPISDMRVVLGHAREPELIPAGYKLMSIADVKSNLSKAKSLMKQDRWIVALSDGKFDGKNGGYKLTLGDYHDKLGGIMVAKYAGKGEVARGSGHFDHR